MADPPKDSDGRGVAELYAEAADQLEADDVSVRLAGTCSLEKLAQDNPDRRQAVVDLLCAHLRTPRHPHREVRVAAQRVLAEHLRPGGDPDRPGENFWENIDIDLTGATLVGFSLSGCRVRTAWFARARFDGITWFDGVRFNEKAWFVGARFTGAARFDATEFGGDARFDGVRFDGFGCFDNARFSGLAGFDGVRFRADAGFARSEFCGQARFVGAEFRSNTWFLNVEFRADVLLRAARVRLDVPADVERIWPAGSVTVRAVTDRPLLDNEGSWGTLSIVDADVDLPNVD